jgi:hypothetical protein
MSPTIKIKKTHKKGTRKNKHFRNKTIKNKQNYSHELFLTNFKVKTTILERNDYQKIMHKLKTHIPDCCTGEKKISYYDIIKAISHDFTDNIYIYGGTVRDFIRTRDIESIHDIDVWYTISPKEAYRIVSRLPVRRMINKYDHIIIGNKIRGNNMDLLPFQPKKLNKPYLLESKMNSLFFQIKKDQIILYDLFNGDASKDAEQKIWRAPSTDYQKWLSNKKLLLWRLLKFELRGYSVPLETKQEVYKYYFRRKNRSMQECDKLWKRIDPDLVEETIRQLCQDLDEVRDHIGISSCDYFKLLIEKKLLVPNTFYGDLDASDHK